MADYKILYVDEVGEDRRAFQLYIKKNSLIILSQDYPRLVFVELKLFFHYLLSHIRYAGISNHFFHIF